MYIHRVHPIALPRAMNYNVNVLYISCYHGNHVHDSVSEHFCVVHTELTPLARFGSSSSSSGSTVCRVTHTHTGPM